MKRESAIKLINISKYYKINAQKYQVLHDFNLDLGVGEIIAIVGRSGSGKSTLLQIAGLLDAPSSGNIIINDNISCCNINDKIKTKLRLKYLGYLYQFHYLLPEFTAIENLVIPQLINNIDKKSAKKYAEQILEEVSLSDKKDIMINYLSGGEQQRVAIARSMINDPSVILADEPTGNLDKDNATATIQLLLNRVKKHGKSAIIVTHDTNIAQKADRIITI